MDAFRRKSVRWYKKNAESAKATFAACLGVSVSDINENMRIFRMKRKGAYIRRIGVLKNNRGFRNVRA